MVGKSLSHYKILEELGRGGMGIVYKAEDTKLDRTVAIKVLPAAALTNESDRARFYREAKAAAALTHPHIAIIHGVDEAVPEGAGNEDLRPFIAMEFIDGETLEDRIEKGPLKLEEAIRITSEVASALQLAHENEIVHRDVKSANVMLSKKGSAKVLDFGLAQTAQSTKLTRLGSTLGTVTFMSPEQARGEEVDRRTDIFSLGVMLYHMVSGTMPFGAEYEQAVVYSIINEDPEPLTALRTGVPMELERIINKCLAKEAKRRYQHADDLIADLEGVDIQDTRASALSGSASYAQAAAPATSSGKRRWVWPLITVTAAILASLATWTFAGGEGKSGSLSVASMSRITIESTTEMHASIHPSGDRVVYAAGEPANKRLYYRLIEGGPPIRLIERGDVDEYYPSYSPDGNLVLFASQGSIYTVEALGGVPRPVIRAGTGREIYQFPTWSPDGSAVAFSSFTDSLHVVDVATGAISFSAYFSQPHSLSWSPNGRFLAFVGENIEHAMFGNNLGTTTVWVMDLSNKATHQISSADFSNLSPRWSPGSDTIYYVSNQFGGQDVYSQRLSTSGEAEGGPERLTSGLNLHSIDMSVDGNRLVASELKYHQNIWAWPINLGRIATALDGYPITSGDQVIEALALTPDRTRIAYDSNARGISHLFVMPMAGGTPLQVTDRELPDFIYDWSPYSDELSFHTFYNGSRRAGVVSISDQRPNFFPDHELHERYPFWLEDKNTLAFHREIGPMLHNLQRIRRNAAGEWGAPERIIDRLREGARYSLVRDQIAYAFGENIFVWDRKTEESRVVAQTKSGVPTYPDWSPDGNTIYFLFTDEAGDRSFRAVSADGGPIRTIVDLLGANKSRYYGRVDEKNIYGTIIEIESDIWVLDLSRGE